MEFADQDGAIDQAAHLVDLLLVHLVSVIVQAVNVEGFGQADDLWRRRGTEAQSQVQVIGIVLAYGGGGGLDELLVRLVEERRAALGGIAPRKKCLRGLL